MRRPSQRKTLLAVSRLAMIRYIERGIDRSIRIKNEKKKKIFTPSAARDPFSYIMPDGTQRCLYPGRYPIQYIYTSMMR